MKRIILYVFLAVLTMPCFGGNELVTVSATYEYHSDNDRETPEQAERKAIERAKLKALEDQFGVDVTSITNTLMTDRSENGKAQAQRNVFALGGTSVRGEWIETIKEKVLDKTYTNGFWFVKVYVQGKARHSSAEKAQIHYSFVKYVQDVDAPVAFKDGNDIFLRFSSPVGGYLCVYLVDESQTAYCLLPYMNQQSGNYPIEANKEYLFFSEKYDPLAQEYVLNCDKQTEQNALYVVFSPKDFTKAADVQSGKNSHRDEGQKGTLGIQPTGTEHRRRIMKQEPCNDVSQHHIP